MCQEHFTKSKVVPTPISLTRGYNGSNNSNLIKYEGLPDKLDQIPYLISCSIALKIHIYLQQLISLIYTKLRKSAMIRSKSTVKSIDVIPIFDIGFYLPNSLTFFSQEMIPQFAFYHQGKVQTEFL